MPGRTLSLLVAVAAWFPAMTAHAQDINEGKPPPQLFATACAGCHQSPRGLGRQVAPAFLVNFLRQHYTTSREQAAVLAAYVASFANEPPAQRAAPRTPRQEAGRPPGQEEGRGATRRRPPSENGRPDQQMNAPTSPRRDSRPPARRQPAEAPVSTERPVVPEQQPDEPTSALAPSTARTDDIAD